MYFSGCLDKMNSGGRCSCGAETPEMKEADDSLYSSIIYIWGENLIDKVRKQQRNNRNIQGVEAEAAPHGPQTSSDAGPASISSLWTVQGHRGLPASG